MNTHTSTIPARQRPSTLASIHATNTFGPPRLDLYEGIHKAVRASLFEALVRLGRIDVDDREDSTEALDQLADALDFLTAHLQHEDEFMHPAIEARRPSGSERAGQEHAAHAEAIGRLHDDSAALRAGRGGDGAAMARQLYLDLSVLVADTLEHLHYEETVLNPLLWQLFSDKELSDIHVRLRASITPADMLVAIRWVLRASTPRERATLAWELKAAMPPEALIGVLASVREDLDEAGWVKLARAAGLSTALGRTLEQA